MESARPPDRPDLDPALTPIQREIIRVISDLAERQGHGASYREIGKVVGRAPSSVARQVAILEKKGKVRRDLRRPRTVVVAQPDGQQAGADPAATGSPKMADVPLVGQIAAGGPSVAEESIEDTFALPRRLVGEGPLIMLKVRGDSMTGAGISGGDLVVVRRQPDAQNGDIVAALIEGRPRSRPSSGRMATSG